MRQLVAVLLVAGALVLGLSSPPRAADDPGANRLLVEAVTLVEEAEATESPADRAQLYEAALGKLDAIVADHPGSDLAVKLATRQPIGVLERAEIERRWRLSSAEECIASWDRLCLLVLVFDLLDVIDDSSDRSWVRAMVSRGQAEGEAFEQSLEGVDSIEDLRPKAWALGAVGKLLARSGHRSRSRHVFDRAIVAVGSIADAYERSLTLGEIAALQADAGDKRGARAAVRLALHSVRHVSDDWERAIALVAIAEPLAKVGNTSESRRFLREADQIASRIDDPGDRSNVLSSLAWVQAEIGDLPDALRTLARSARIAAEISTDLGRNKALVMIVRGEANTGIFDLAYEMIQKFSISYYRALALADTATAQVKFGDADGARQSVRLAFQAIVDLENIADISTALAYLLGGMSVGGSLEKEDEI